MGTLAKAICVSVFGVLGIVLLVAGKSTAGAAFVCSAVLMALPIERLVPRKRPALGLRAAMIGALCILAIRSIAHTDIVPDQATTGYVFVDQVLAIVRRFQEKTIGRAN